MSFCSRVKTYARAHEWIADTFSLLAVALLFASVWAAMAFHPAILAWMGQNVILHTPAVVGLIALDVLLIFGFICVGSARCPEDQGCFRTFRGRRHGSPGLGTALRNWIHHIENVGKSHR
jgi:hypothetical protein